MLNNGQLWKTHHAARIVHIAYLLHSQSKVAGILMRQLHTILQYKLTGIKKKSRYLIRVSPLLSFEEGHTSLQMNLNN